MNKRPLASLGFVLLALFLLESSFGQKRFTPGFPSQKLTQNLVREMSSREPKAEPLKIWVYFTDKGFRSEETIKQALEETRRMLDESCLWRRSKVLTEEHLVDFCDLPVYPAYVEKLASQVQRIRAVSRWLNAASVEATPAQAASLSRLDFVKTLDLVFSFSREEPASPARAGLDAGEDFPIDLDYGPSFSQVNQINVLSLHRLGYSGKDVIVCMMDVGFRKSHEVFRSARLLAEWDFVNNDEDVRQDFNNPKDYSDAHGTATWSLLGGFKPGQLIGPAYGASFLLAKTETTNFEQPIEEDWWVAEIEWAEVRGAEVLSSSLGYTDWYTYRDLDGKTAVTTKAANRAVSLGVVVVNAAGNERDKSWGHIIAPADGFKVIACGAVDSTGRISSFSSPGPTYDGRIKPEVCALGVNNWHAANNNDRSDTYARGSGTSYATPLVAGVAALLLEIHRDWTPDDVRNALLGTSSRASNPDNDYGWGIVNAALAANLAMASPRLESFSLDDDASGRSSGNGNGQAEPGETLEITLTIKNESDVAASNLSASLSTTHPDFELVTSSIKVSSLRARQSLRVEESFVVKIPSDFLGHHAFFRLRVEASGSYPLEEVLRILISR